MNVLYTHTMKSSQDVKKSYNNFSRAHVKSNATTRIILKLTKNQSCNFYQFLCTCLFGPHYISKVGSDIMNVKLL